MSRVNLTDTELVLLDGQVGEKVQVEIVLAQARLETAGRLTDLTPELAGFIADAVAEAKKNGRLIFRYKQLSHCKLCGERGGHLKYKRNSRWHCKGELNYKKPTYVSGIELACRFVTVRGYASVGCCTSCFKKVENNLIAELGKVKAELPKQLVDGKTYKRYQKVECQKCDWKGHEGQMIQKRTLMGVGFYPGGCPAEGCGALNSPFGVREIKTLTEFEVVECKKKTK